MPLTAVIGSSGSGKTTFLNDVQKSHRGTYIRQYHNMRPYIVVTRIPNFDPTKLPFWDIYEREGTASTIRAGGTMAGEVTAGLSGGQRKMLLFELICQRVQSQKDLLIILDEPFAGVTDNFVPYVIERLEELRAKHNVLLVTNDHVQAITKMADNTITVSAVDRSMVTVNKRQKKREKTIGALSIGERYTYESSNADLQFFLDTELWKNRAINYLLLFTVVAFSLMLLAFWNSDESNIGLILIGAEMVAFFTINPYLLSLVDWRNAMNEESEALIHSSKGMNKILKTLVTGTIVVMTSAIEFMCINVVFFKVLPIRYLIALIFENYYIIFPYAIFGIYSNFSVEAVSTIGGILYLNIVFFSTAYSPGSGLPVIKELRYLFPRFYFWCMLPELGEQMEGCPSDDVTLLYLILSSLLGLVCFGIVRLCFMIQKIRSKKAKSFRLKSMVDHSFLSLEVELKGGSTRLNPMTTVKELQSKHDSITGMDDWDEEDDIEDPLSAKE
jgi:ABC-type lipoprotein export system ATPase subunit